MTNATELSAHRRRDSHAAAVRAVVARAAGRRLHRLAARHGLRASRARQGRPRRQRDPAPPPLHGLSRRRRHRDRRPRSSGDFDAAIIMECGDLARTGVDRPRPVLRHQHRPPPRQHRLRPDQLVRSRRRPRAARWCSTSSRALGVPLSREIATHIYLAILTDTGSFHYSSISPRTFDICRAGARGRRRPGARRAEACTTATPWAA